MTVNIKAIGIIMLVCTLVYIAYRSYRFINLDKGLDKMIRQGAVILDVRTEGEFRTGHIEGAINLPLSRLHADKLPLDTALVYIAVCSHGLRSVKAVGLLKEQGYKAYNGGAWSDLEGTLQAVQEGSRK